MKTVPMNRRPMTLCCGIGFPVPMISMSRISLSADGSHIAYKLKTPFWFATLNNLAPAGISID